MTSQSETYDLLIVGAGPAGLSCAIEAGKAGLKYLVLDKGGIVNSIQQFRRNMFFFSTPELLQIGDVPFIVPTTRPTALDCVNYYRHVSDHYALRCQFYESITSLGRTNGVFTARSSRGSTHLSHFAVIATGYYDTPNPLTVPGEDLPHVSHRYRDPLPLYKQRVLVVGGKNSAVEAALDLYRHGADVTVVHRGGALSEGVKPWLLPDFQNRVADGKIRFHLNTSVRRFLGGRTELQNTGGTTWEVDTDFAFILIGYRPNTNFLQSSGIRVDGDSLAPHYDPDTMETNVPGLFVAGGMVGGRFNNRVFIENGREHGTLIVRAITRTP